MELTALSCACGCGELAAVDRRRRRVSRYRAGHNSRVAHPMAGQEHTDVARAKIRARRAEQRNVGAGGPVPRPDAERFFGHVSTPSSCWEWTGACDQKGYGAFGIGSTKDGTARVVRAHRFSYEHFVGPVPDGLELDHLCRNRRCVNPEHLEPVTHAENIRRAHLGRPDRGGQ